MRFFLISSLLSVALHAKCPSAWKPFGNSCYYFGRHANFDKAERICEYSKANLTSVHSAEENRFISEMTRAKSDSGFSWFHHTWIGLERREDVDRMRIRDDEQEDPFYFVDNTTITFENWYPGEPTNTNGVERCAVILNKSPPGWSNAVGKWSDVNCNIIMNFFVCKKIMNNSP